MTSTSQPWPGNRVEPGSVRKRALVLPGRGYTVAYPLLHWTCAALAEGGWFVQTVTWDTGDLGANEPTGQRYVEYVTAGAARAAEEMPAAETTLVVGKSLGTFATGWATERRWPGAWLTPLLGRPEVRHPLLDAVRHGIPGLLVGGSADPSWNGVSARETGMPVHEVAGGDHSLETRTGWADSARNVSEAVAAVAAFAGSLGG